MQELAANSTHADLETWACASPKDQTHTGPGMNRTVLQIMLIATPPLALKNLKYQNTQNNATSSTHVDEHA